MYAPIIKTAAWALIIIELWLLLQVPAVGDALFSFIVGGEVPGTSKILTLNEMIFFLAGVFVLAVGLLFHREINLLVGGMRRPQQKTATHAVAPAIRPKASKPKTSKMSRVKHRRPVFRTFLRKVAPILVEIETISLYWLHIGMANARKAARYGAVTGSYYAHKAWTITVAHTKAFWRWLRPRIERFDRWLDRKLHKNDQTASLLSFGNEMAKTVKAWVAYARVLKNKYLSLK